MSDTGNKKSSDVIPKPPPVASNTEAKFTQASSDTAPAEPPLLSSLTMSDSALVTKARKARFDDLPTFSGLPSEDADLFLKRLRYVFSTDDDTFITHGLHIVRGKLINSAGYWFDKYHSNFTCWSDFEYAFREHYALKDIHSIKFSKLLARRQQQGEPVTTYYDEILDLCEDLFPETSNSVIIDFLLNGLRPEYRREVSRYQSTFSTPNDFLERARIEQSLYDASHPLTDTSLISSAVTQPQTSTVSQPSIKRPFYTQPRRFPPRASNYYYQSRYQSYQPRFQSNQSYRPRGIPSNPRRPAPSSFANSTASQHQNSTTPTSSSTQSDASSNRPNSSTNTVIRCKVCNRTNHRSIDCYYKRQSGCFNCGKLHHVNDCRLPPSFQSLGH